MRTRNKKSIRLADDKKGVILITVLFIVAVALIFVTTALTISIASRNRVYADAKSDQARLTVTSLAQSIWQSIYSQQISDAELESLASAGSLVTFTDSDIPGMVGSSSTTAYFYYPDETDTSKIAIECKCDIGGEAQYYTLVLHKNQGETLPSPMFNLTVNLGDAGLLNRCNFGLDARTIDLDNSYSGGTHGSDNNWARQNGFAASDNVMFIHGRSSSVTSNTSGSGFYGKVITDGVMYIRDACFADDVYFIGQNAGFDWSTTSQNSEAANGSHGDLYFWGTSAPFYREDEIRHGHFTDSLNLCSVDDIYFDLRPIDAANSSIQLNTTTEGFDQFDYSSPDMTFQVHGDINYECHDGVNALATYTYSTPADTSARHTYTAGTFGWQQHGNMDTQISGFVNGYLTVNADDLDTATEVNTTYSAAHRSEAVALDLTQDSLTPANKTYYYIPTGSSLDHVITCNVSTDTVIFVDGTFTIGANNGSSAGFFMNTSGDHKVIFVLRGSSSQITIQGGNTSDNGNPYNNWFGFVDARCFGRPAEGTNPAVAPNYLDVHTLNQAQSNVPRFYIFTDTAGSTRQPLKIGDGSSAHMSNFVVTAFIGFFPSTESGSDGPRLFVESGPGTVYYGRIACGGIDIPSQSGGNFNVPYCPKLRGEATRRAEAYRDNTNYSVVTEECGYFTVSTQ